MFALQSCTHIRWPHDVIFETGKVIWPCFGTSKFALSITNIRYDLLTCIICILVSNYNSSANKFSSFFPYISIQRAVKGLRVSRLNRYTEDYKIRFREKKPSNKFKIMELTYLIGKPILLPSPRVYLKMNFLPIY